MLFASAFIMYTLPSVVLALLPDYMYKSHTCTYVCVELVDFSFGPTCVHMYSCLHLTGRSLSDKIR